MTVFILFATMFFTSTAHAGPSAGGIHISDDLMGRFQDQFYGCADKLEALNIAVSNYEDAQAAYGECLAENNNDTSACIEEWNFYMTAIQAAIDAALEWSEDCNT
jgi:hypothetical protein